MRRLLWTLVAGLSLTLSAAWAEEGRQADPADVASIDAIMAAVYDVISGPAGEARDWRRMRTLFHPDARLTARAANGGTTPVSVDGYIERATPFFQENGFFESEIARETDRYGGIAHVFSTYEARRTPDGEPFARGINSFQLLDEGGRWWVLSIFWQQESEDTPIPQEYLP